MILFFNTRGLCLTFKDEKRREAKGIIKNFLYILFFKFEHYIINFNKFSTMSYFCFPQYFTFSPYIYNQAPIQDWNLCYQTIQMNQSHSDEKKLQQNKLLQNQNQQDESAGNKQDQKFSSNSISLKTKEKKKQQKKKRGLNKEKELESAKKNSQSNIINQFYSFFSCRTQSEEIVEKAILSSVRHIEELQKIISIFYNIMKCMSLQRLKKYVNKKTLLNVFGRQNIEKQIPEIVQKFQSLNFITIEQTTQVIRKCCFYFLRNISLVSILSSKRISNLSKKEHLKKRRMLSYIVSGKI